LNGFNEVQHYLYLICTHGKSVARRVVRGPRFPLLVAKAPTELQKSVSSGADIDRRARATYRWIEHGLKRLEEFPFLEKLVDALHLAIPPKQLGVDEAFTKTQLLIRFATHEVVLP
jgi:hypothetical protein